MTSATPHHACGVIIGSIVKGYAGTFKPSRPTININLKITIMKKTFFYFLLALIVVCQCYFVAQTYKQHKLLQQYRDFVDYLDKTDETFEVAMETDYYTTLIQEDRL